jgi:hypothetical protein
MKRFQMFLPLFSYMPFVGAWNSAIRVVCADARTLVSVVPQLLLRGSVLSCPAIRIAVALATAVALAVASAEVPPIDPMLFGVGVPLALLRE